MANIHKRLRLKGEWLTDRLLDHTVGDIVEHLRSHRHADITVVNETPAVEREFLQQQLDSAIAFTRTSTRVGDGHWRRITWLQEQLDNIETGPGQAPALTLLSPVTDNH